ncbi:hypothetical protein RvY_00074-4 [Ramazzottius varieornatus]|nr:hypothetical protein RvY_00074-4 [Ramazzottius varieornatus]
MRVTLARAVYADADIIILDDPLAAVDAHVGQHIFEHVIGPNGMLQGKTRIFVTNAVNWLPQTDQVVHVEQGRICSIGRYEDLVETDELFRSYLQDSQVDVSEAAGHHHHGANAALTQPTNHLAPYATEADADPRKATPIDGTELRTATKKRHGKETTKLIGVEEFRDGGVTWQTYKLLARNMTYWMVAIVLVGYALGSAFFLVSNTWIGTLTTHNYTLADGSVDQRYKGFGLAIYAVFILAQLIFVAFGLWGVSYGIIKAGRSLHNSMLQRLIRSPMSYFDTTPLGRILNRFSKDIDTIDLTVPSYMRYFLNAFFLSMAFAFLIMIEIPLTIVFVVPLMAALYLVKLFYQKTAMQLTRIDAMKRAPLISSLQQSFAGSNVIVATGNSNRFIAESHQKVDELTAVIHLSNGASQWLAFNSLIITNILTTVVGLLAVFGRDNLPFGKEAASVGLALTSTVAFNIIVQWLVQNLCDLEQSLLSTERIRDYSDAPIEAPAVIPDNRPPPKWPYQGKITFTNYEARYRPGLDLVLRGVNVTIAPGEKIGVVGRTASGKSSLTLALLRIIEPASGSISIDGTDISKIGLHDLRSRITIIPQESALFSGSLRLNIDPTEEADDQQIWDALQSSRLKAFFQNSPHGLNTPISEGGSNLSVGQRQLMCLARALLRRSKILILDEATAAIDFETDQFVQEVVRKEFADETVISIAHRIHTIMDCDRVLVMDAGRIVEFDSPATLLDKHDSLFYQLAKTAGAI